MSVRYDYRPSIKPVFHRLSIVLVLAFCFSPFIANAHTAFTSFTRIDFDSKTDTLNLALQMHVHELEILLTDIAGTDVSFKDTGQTETIEATLRSLISEHIKLTVDTSATDVMLLGFEQKKDTIFIYLKGEIDDRPNMIEFDNSILFDRNQGQINSVMAVVDENRKAGEVTIKSGPITLEF